MRARLLALACLAALGCASNRSRARAADDLSLTKAFASALEDGRFDEARAEADRLQASGRMGAALRARVAIAKRVHDAAAVRALASDPHIALLEAEPVVYDELARAVLWTVGVAEAGPFLERVCADPRLSPDFRDRQKACAYAALARAARAKPRALEGEERASVDLVTKIPLPIVLASVNGRATEPFIFDTGAATSVLSKAYCDRAGIPYLKDSPHTSNSPGGPLTLYPALVDRLELGGVVMRNWTAQVVQLPPELEVGGILAPQDTLRGALVELDGRALKVRIYRDLDEQGWTELVHERVHAEPLVWGDGNMLVRARVADLEQGWFLFDTGAGACELAAQTATRIGHAPDPASARGSVTAGAQGQVFQQFSETIAVGSAPPRREEIVVISEPEPDELPHLGSIGFPWMLGRRVALSRDGTQVLFTDALAGVRL